MSVPRILLVDDQRDIVRLLHSTLDTLGHDLEVMEMPSGEEALLEALRRKVDLLITDYRLPGMTGVELMHKIRVHFPDMRVILITGMTDRKAREEILNAGAAAVFDKPISLTDFLDTVERLLGLARTILPAEDAQNMGQQHTLSALLANFRQDISAQAVILLSNRGRVLARAGDLKDNSMEASLLSAMMAIYNAGLKASHFIHQEKLASYHVFAGGDHDLLLIPVNAAYALLLAGNGLATTEKILDTVSALLAVRDEVEKALKHMGIAYEDLADENALDQDGVKYAEPVTQTTSDEIDTLLKNQKALSPDELKMYWDEAVEKQSNVPISTDMVSYEQARQLGLIPGDED